MRATIYGTSFENRALLSGDRNRSAANDRSRVNQSDDCGAKADYQADRRSQP